ncbi:MAG: histidinol dehydrogenase [Gammaproteobacteria bacterium]|nr:histidinol dehydrogenase [Gammaproteobacteria bacterium]
MFAIRRLSSAEPNFDDSLKRLLAMDAGAGASVRRVVEEIIADVRERGDIALLEYTNRFDRRAVTSAALLEITDFAAYPSRIDAQVEFALRAAATRIRDYHEHQKQNSWRYTDAHGTILGQLLTPLETVGVYVPGGKAAYPSSVLMNVLPAKVAGVEQIVMVVPAPGGIVEPVVLAAAAIAQVDRVFSIGGAQAIAALAYGTATIPAVDKIVGPGNSYVASAKAQVFGKVGIDMIAGPSEILIICDGATDPDWIAMDLFAQAEHDEEAQAILVATKPAFLDTVATSIERLLPSLERAPIVAQSLAARGAFILVRDLQEAAAVANRVAPEHLELSIADPEALLPHIRHAGAIFMGRFTPEALGDYCAGPNHVLPTAGAARFSSPLGVYDFQKRTSLIGCSVAGASALSALASTLAREEGLTAHARSAEYRRSL